MEGDNLVVMLEDHGRSYDPNFHSAPRPEDLTLPLQSKPVGGLGIYLARDGVDDLQYQATDKSNIHRFIVRLAHRHESRK